MLSLPAHSSPHSPIQKKKRQPLLRRDNRSFEDDAAPLLSPRTCRSADSWFALEKTVPADDARGLSLTSDATYGGAIVSGIERTSLAAMNGLLVGDDIRAVDGCALSSTAQALRLLNASDRKVMMTVSGSTREVRLDKSEASAVGLTIGAAESTRGVRLVGVAGGSLAEAAGLRVGDIILAVNETLAHSHEQAVALINAVAREVRLVVVAQGAQALPTAGRRPGTSLTYVTAVFGQGPYGMTVRGLNVDDLVFIKEVESDGQAARQGIKPGSVLLKVGDVKVDGLEYEDVVHELKTAARPVRIVLSVPL